VISGFGDPQVEWKSVLDVFEAAYAHEQKVTKLINNLTDIALEKNDHASQIFLQWFVAEQVEEEATAKGIIQQLRLIGDSRAGLFQIDRELGQRVYTPPAAEE
jgi:ferritin